METGSKLQQARIARGFTLAQLSNATKISLHVLQLIEKNDFSQLPGGLLTRGHLRAFASAVGLDPEQIVNEYRTQFETSSPENEPFKLRSSYQEPESSAPSAALILLIGVAIISYFAFAKQTPRTVEMATAAAMADVHIGEKPVIDRAVALTQAARLDAPTSVVSSDAEGLQIELRPHSECWVSATADGRLVIYRLMQAGERATVDAVGEVLLRVGDAGALAYSVNGGAGRPLGAPGEAVTVRITSDNSTTWLKNESSEPREVNGGGDSALESDEARLDS